MNSHLPIKYRQQIGMTLIEIMIALLIGAFLLGGVVEIFIGTKQTNRVEENLSRLQEDGRYAIDFLMNELRRADYQCNPRASSSDTAVGGIISLADPRPTVNDDVAVDSVLDGTDKITITLVTIDGAPFNDGVPNGQEEVIGTNVNRQGNCTASATLSITYEIRTGAGGRPSLFRTLAAPLAAIPPPAAAQELVEGIEDMQIVYGVDTENDGSANYYDTYNNIFILATPNIVSLRVSLLAATIENNISSEPLTYYYNGQTITAPDRRIRRVFTSTIALRNRVR